MKILLKTYMCLKISTLTNSTIVLKKHPTTIPYRNTYCVCVKYIKLHIYTTEKVFKKFLGNFREYRTILHKSLVSLSFNRNAKSTNQYK